MRTCLHIANLFIAATLLGACSGDGSKSLSDASQPDGGGLDAAPDSPQPATSDRPVKSITWGSEDVVTTADLTVAFNNTSIGARDKNDGLHVTWLESQKNIRYAYLAKGSSAWSLRDVPRTSTTAVSKPTLSMNGTTAIVVWNEAGANGVVAANATADFGATWAGPLQISEGAGTSASLVANVSASSFSASIAWIDSATSRLKVRAISGASWSVASLGAVQTIDANATKPSGDPQIFGAAPSLYVTWDNGEETGGHDVHLAQSSDGVHFTNEHLIGVTQAGRTLNSGNDTGGCASGPAVYLGYQDGNAIYVARSTDGGKTFEPKGKVGDGLFAHLECLSERAVAVAWESFTGNNLHNDDVKTVGSVYTLDGFDTNTGPHAIPGSDVQMARILGTASHSDSFLDYWWVEKTASSAKLGHRAATLTRE